eukprot:CAMPEP_0118804946 /NCGR_PEP_ID=MMETSP1161-20130426/25313_1 /TAXON_ID=249345 /ORGANISM="Picochlorum oklahomensis, Strain CCMP2329" /LENGTH=75 /DNA_ID=CAMNT_0006733803 /DNA_START=39 /DNA_END=263 /DNA_ORIENTATION=-
MPSSTPEAFSKECAELIRTALEPVEHLCLVDVSDGHTVEGFKDGRAHKPDAIEFFALVVTNNFEGKTRVERHQMV